MGVGQVMSEGRSKPESRLDQSLDRFLGAWTGAGRRVIQRRGFLGGSQERGRVITNRGGRLAGTARPSAAVRAITAVDVTVRRIGIVGGIGRVAGLFVAAIRGEGMGVGDIHQIGNSKWR